MCFVIVRVTCVTGRDLGTNEALTNIPVTGFGGVKPEVMTLMSLYELKT